MCILDRRTREMLRATEPPGGPYYRDVEMEMPAPRGVWREPALSWMVVMKLYDATSFLTRHYGVCFDTHLIIGFGLMGLDDREGAALMPVFNKEMKRWLALNCRRRRGPNRTRGGAGYHYVYTLEHGRNRGLHAHQLCTVPTAVKHAFEAHARQWWARAAGLSPACARCTYPWRPLPHQAGVRPRTKAGRSLCPGMPGVHGCARHGADTLGIKMPERAIYLKHRPARYPDLDQRRQSYWLRYILKTMKPGEAGWTDDAGAYTPLEAALKVKLRIRPAPSEDGLPHGVDVAQLYGIAHTLSAAAQRRTGFRSKLRQGLFDEAYSRWEWAAYERDVTLRTFVL